MTSASIQIGVGECSVMSGRWCMARSRAQVPPFPPQRLRDAVAIEPPEAGHRVEDLASEADLVLGGITPFSTVKIAQRSNRILAEASLDELELEQGEETTLARRWCTAWIRPHIFHSPYVRLFWALPLVFPGHWGETETLSQQLAVATGLSPGGCVK